MKCLEFHERHDAGDLASLERDAREHAAACPDCARALAHAAALEAALDAELGGAPAPVGAHFTERLMARVEVMPQARLAPADLARAVAISFASPPIALAGLAGAALLALSAAAGFDPVRISAATVAAAAPLARLVDDLVRPLPAAGAAHELAVAGVLLAGLPLLVLLVGAAWQLGNLIGDRAPRAL
jgi:hypothetical protein